MGKKPGLIFASRAIWVGAAPAKAHHQYPRPEYRVDNIEHRIGHPPHAMRNPVGELLQQGCRQNEKKGHPGSERSSGDDPGKDQYRHAAVNMGETVRCPGHACYFAAERAVKVDNKLHSACMVRRGFAVNGCRRKIRRFCTGVLRRKYLLRAAAARGAVPSSSSVIAIEQNRSRDIRRRRLVISAPPSRRRSAEAATRLPFLRALQRFASARFRGRNNRMIDDASESCAADRCPSRRWPDGRVGAGEESSIDGRP